MRETLPTTGESTTEVPALSTAKGNIFFLFLLATEGVRPVWRGAEQTKWTHICLSIPNSNSTHDIDLA